MKSQKRIFTDVLIVGSGLAGATAAYFLAEKGYDVILLSTDNDPFESASNYAQGGIVYTSPKDSPKKLYNDILAAGCGINYQDALTFLCENGPSLVKDFLIDTLGIEFTRNAKGELDLTLEAAHSENRIIHALDKTGNKIIEKLLEKLRDYKNVKCINGATAIDLITPGHHSVGINARYEMNAVIGSYVYEQSKGEVLTILSGKTILATGGVGQVYLHTTNPACSRGDGLAMAFRAKADLINCEFVQFHPTAFYQRDAERFLISESVRGEGARLMNLRKKYFMKDYSELGDLAPRDVASRAIHTEMLKTGDTNVLLDLSEIRKKGIQIESRFPSIYKTCKSYGIDVSKELVPVVPAAHYFCGGVKVDLYGRSSIKNLYVIGESSCTGVHGANRLASTSLLESMLWAWSSAKDITETGEVEIYKNHKEIPDWVTADDEDIDPALIVQDKITIKTTMWNYGGIVKSTKRLERAEKDLSYLKGRMEQFYKRATLSDELIGLRNMIQTSLIIIQSALRNKQSIGCHYRKD
ncbi:MAG: L-aspartate oxidase [Nitrospinae bacterium]|nr:L-aspartate oxidase [Nitrospinota bacterium]